MAQRIKGQEVEVLLVADGAPVDSLTDVRSFDVTFQLEILTEGYLGETTNRRDEVFNGISGSMELHFEDPGVFEFISAVVDRAQRRTPGVRVNIKATLAFPNGQRTRVIIQNAFFGDIPLSFGGRSEYGTLSLTYEAESLSVI